MKKENFTNSRSNDGICARRRPAIMATRLQSHIKSRAFRRFTGIPQRHHFGMRSMDDLSMALSYNAAFFNDNSPDCRIRIGDTDGKQGFFKSEISKIHCFESVG